jgi:phospholipid-binding lipoprotein MlaA
MSVTAHLALLLRPAGLALALLATAACSVAPPGVDIHDPYEPVNRQVHAFNVGLDSAILRPTSRAAAQLPPEVRRPIANFADNVGLPGTVLNGLLQGDIGGAATNTFRFLINSTVGVLGLFDPAGAIGLAADKTDFGETLAVWGIPEGAYLELPILGPSTERDALGEIVDFLIDPLKNVGTDAMRRYGTVARVAARIIDRVQYASTVDSILYESADSYAQLRLFYLQNRRFELAGAAGNTYLPPETGLYIDPYAELQ